MKNRIVHQGIIGIFCSLYFLVATISMINSVAFFDLAHTGLMNWALAIGFELGAAASLAAIIILDKTNKAMVWGLFLLLTAFQMMANSYHAFVNLENFQGWIELFGLQDEELIFQKRILSIVSGAVLPVVALGFIKSLTDYLKPTQDTIDIPEVVEDNEDLEESLIQAAKVVEVKEKHLDKIDKVIEEARKDEPNDITEIKKKHQERIKTKSTENMVNTTKSSPIKSMNDELQVEVDEETGVTSVTTKQNPNINNPL